MPLRAPDSPNRCARSRRRQGRHRTRFAALASRIRRLAISVLATPVVGVLAAATAASPLSAQQLQAFAVQDNNGQFDFWLPPVRRPDTELTNGANLRLDFDGAPIWRGLYPSVPACSAASLLQRCSTTEFRIGQDMYTPSASIWSAQPVPGQRPYAGWLYLSGTGRVASPVVSDAVTFEVGVTGVPSLAEQVQTSWHALIRFPPPLGWSHQIPFQIGGLVTAEHQREVLQATIGGIPVLSLVPAVSVSMGNVLTGASLGADARLGYGVSTPWTAVARGHSLPFEVYALAGIRENLVITDLFLDEETTSPGWRVEKVPFVTQYEVGGGVRIHAWRFEYRGVTRTREYLTGPPQSAYGMLTVGMELGRSAASAH